MLAHALSVYMSGLIDCRWGYMVFNMDIKERQA
ncbi:hypothetical protein X942_5594 [Burkholderia pseudomallei MSHR5596]|nr:hypothetical protein X942_5594 [Burkholderia pseudomallei MSHR5596]